MHLGLLIGTLVVALAIRWRWQPGLGSWRQRWWRAVLGLSSPLILLLSTAMAILGMGHHGTMLGWAVGPLGCRISQVGLGLGLVMGLHGLGQIGWTTWVWQRYAWVQLPQGISARLVDTAVPLAAQVGFWRSALIVSRGWLDQLSREEQGMILAHEQAHAHYHDPLWFWLLGIVRRLTGWLPNTQALWQELLLLREIRADRWAAHQAHPLAVAELLVKISHQTALGQSAQAVAPVAFSQPDELDRLEQRVEALLQPMPEGDHRPAGIACLGLTLALFPFLAMVFHQ